MTSLVPVGTVAELTKRKRMVVDHDGTPILVLLHDGTFYAMDNLCIHRDRELLKGVVLNGKLVCPGHQWAFELASGWEAVKETCQPTYAVVVDGDTVAVDVASRRTSREPAPAGDT